MMSRRFKLPIAPAGALRVAVAIIIAHAMSLHAQPAFDVDAYRRFLDANATLDASGLLREHDAGWFLRSAGSGFQDALFADSIDHYYALTSHEKELVARNGFMATERLRGENFGSIFLDIYNRDLPVFVSTDAILHAIHRSYDDILIETERGHLIPKLADLLTILHERMPALAARYAKEPAMGEMLRDVDLYLAVPRMLLAEPGRSVKPYFAENARRAADLLELIKKETPSDVQLMASVPRTVDFSQFTPRGHYTQGEDLTRYFKAMIWLGRTEIYLIAPKSTGYVPTDADVQRQTVDAVLLAELADGTAARARLGEIETVLASFVGEQDNVTLANLDALVAETGLKGASALLDLPTWKSFQSALRAKGNAFQRINSQILMSDPMSPDQLAPASAFLLLGQRFIIDSYVTGELVYDKIIHDGAKVMRMLPSSYDILFALGNDAAGQLLKPEIDRYHFAPNIAALRYLVDSYDDGFWNGTLYNGWLNMIRSLNPPAERGELPRFMQTAAWWQEKMNTQLASWAQLRHDNLLYAKQSYSGGASCSYPKSLVEPVPDFYRALGRFAESAGGKIGAMAFEDTARRARIVSYFDGVRRTAGMLESIATKELASAPLTEEETTFLKMMLYERLAGCTTEMTGWYPNLYYGRESAMKEKDMVVADVHTAPTDEAGNTVGWVMHGGTGPLDMAVVVCDMPDGKPVAFIGPVMSYYEHVSVNFKRLTDEEWATAYQQAPSLRPAFVNLYLAGPEGGEKGEAISLPTATSSADDPVSPPPSAGTLAVRNYPNPFAASTIISFTIDAGQSGKQARLGIYDEAGVLVKSLLAKDLPAGSYSLRWDGRGEDGKPVAAGVYYSRLNVGEMTATGKMNFLGGAGR